MEKLILRGVMYGADKIPDSWFDKVPGGYYKKQQIEKEAERQRAASREPRKDRDMRYRSHRSHGGGHRDKSRRRRHSDEYEDRRPRYDEDYRAGQRPGYGTDRHRRPDRRSSYDGGDDYYPYDDVVDRGYASGGRRRDYVDNDRYGYDDGYGRTGGRGYGDEYGAPPVGGRREPYSARPPPPGEYVPAEDAAAAAAAGAGAAAAAFANDPRNSGQNLNAPPVGAPPSSGYVPYSHIYGPPTNLRAHGGGSSNGSVQPNNLNQVAPPFSPPSSAVPAPSPYAHGPRYADPYDDPYFDDCYGPDYGYEDDYLPPARPYPYRHERPSRSPSLSSSNPPPRRSRSERLPAKPRGKSLSRMRENFDTSKRGLGYSGVGALAGGLVGSEVGKGAIPAAVGAVLGGIGANAFGARERFVDPRVPLAAQNASRPPEQRQRQSEAGMRPERSG